MRTASASHRFGQSDLGHPINSGDCIMLAHSQEEAQMKTLQRLHPIFCLVGLLLMSGLANAQPPAQNGDGNSRSRGPGKPVTIPLTIRTGSDRELPELQSIDLTVSEDGEPQQILSIRGVTNSPITLAVLIQDDLVPSVANEIKPLAAKLACDDRVPAHG
jgi:hypothetical protein